MEFSIRNCRRNYKNSQFLEISVTSVSEKNSSFCFKQKKVKIGQQIIADYFFLLPKRDHLLLVTRTSLITFGLLEKRVTGNEIGDDWVSSRYKISKLFHFLRK